MNNDKFIVENFENILGKPNKKNYQILLATQADPSEISIQNFLVVFFIFFIYPI